MNFSLCLIFSTCSKMCSYDAVNLRNEGLADHRHHGNHGVLCLSAETQALSLLSNLLIMTMLLFPKCHKLNL